MANPRILLQLLVVIAATLMATSALADMSPGPRCGCQLGPSDVSMGAVSVVVALVAAIGWRRSR